MHPNKKLKKNDNETQTTCGETSPDNKKRIPKEKIEFCAVTQVGGKSLEVELLMINDELKTDDYYYHSNALPHIPPVVPDYYHNLTL